MNSWIDFATVPEPPAGWEKLPCTAWGIMFAWVAGPSLVRVLPLSQSPLGVEGGEDGWVLDWAIEMLSEAGVPQPIWKDWEFYYSGDFDRSSFEVHSAIPSGVPVRPLMMLEAMVATRDRWVTRPPE